MKNLQIVDNLKTNIVQIIAAIFSKLFRRLKTKVPISCYWYKKFGTLNELITSRAFNLCKLDNSPDTMIIIAQRNLRMDENIRRFLYRCASPCAIPLVELIEIDFTARDEDVISLLSVESTPRRTRKKNMND